MDGSPGHPGQGSQHYAFPNTVTRGTKWLSFIAPKNMEGEACNRCGKQDQVENTVGHPK